MNHAELIAAVRLHAGEGVQTDAARQAQRKIADALERLTAGDVAFPDHPEPMVMKWSDLEKKAIAEYGDRRAAAAVLARNEDTARLDFLDSNLRFRMGWSVGRAPMGNLSVDGVIFAGNKPPVPIREAIDAIRKGTS